MPVVTVTIAVKKIDRLLDSRQMLQAGLARERGVSDAAVSKWMNGGQISKTNIEWLIRWAGKYPSGEPYLKFEDFTTPYRHNVAIPDPPLLRRVANPFVEVPKDRPQAVPSGTRRTEPTGDFVPWGSGAYNAAAQATLLAREGVLFSEIARRVHVPPGLLLEVKRRHNGWQAELWPAPPCPRIENVFSPFGPDCDESSC
jgi:hypothetical protein